MGSDGGDPLEDAKNSLSDLGERARKNPLGLAVDLATQIGTGGAVGFEEGRFGRGVTTRALDEGLGEVTGRNGARKEMMNAADRLRAEEAQAAQDLANEQLQAQRDDIAASNAAFGARATSFQRSRRSFSAYGDNQDERDFLGL